MDGASGASGLEWITLRRVKAAFGAARSGITLVRTGLQLIQGGRTREGRENGHFKLYQAWGMTGGFWGVFERDIEMGAEWIDE